MYNVCTMYYMYMYETLSIEHTHMHYVLALDQHLI